MGKAQNGHMRVSIPTIPHTAKPIPNVTLPEAIKRLTDFLRGGATTVLTGAGVSVDSGIKAYRGQDGRYMNPNFQPIFYHELIDETDKGHRFRQRYWLRSYLGYPPVKNAVPNVSHISLAALQHASVVPNIITQNVDGLHQKALQQVAPHKWNPAHARDAILELHGTLHRVSCNKGHTIHRDLFQDFLSAANPQWDAYAQELMMSGTRPISNPDGDVAIEHLGISYSDFHVPDCSTCLLENRRNAIHKPEVIFFGESIPQNVKERSFREVERCDQLLLIGTTLATYSAFRLVKHALELKKPVMLLNIGPTRADGIQEIQKLNIASGVVLREVAKEIIGEKAMHELVLASMPHSNFPPDGGDSAPRAAG